VVPLEQQKLRAHLSNALIRLVAFLDLALLLADQCWWDDGAVDSPALVSQQVRPAATSRMSSRPGKGTHHSSSCYIAWLRLLDSELAAANMQKHRDDNCIQ